LTVSLTRSPLRAGAARHSVALVLLALATLLLAASPASADRAYAPRFQTTDRGQILTAANTLLSCSAPAAACRHAQSGLPVDNNRLAMDHADVDSDASTFDSSRATLALPSGATVLYAGLYWSADTSAGDDGVRAPDPGARASVRLAPPAAAYRAITADVLDTDATSATRYAGFADVTAIVAAAGAGTYTVANVQAGTGAARHAGWGLVVVYRSVAEPMRRLAVYDGLLTLQALRPSVDVAMSGFVTPSSGTVRGRLALLAWEGDRGMPGDSATLASRPLSDAANPVTDLFTSSISRAGTAVTARDPSYTRTCSASTLTRWPSTGSSRTARRPSRFTSGRSSTSSSRGRSRWRSTTPRPLARPRRRSAERRATGSP
jgi:hypothetical protein